jgi:hypothetical protein
MRGRCATAAISTALFLLALGACHGAPTPTLDQACAERAVAACGLLSSCQPVSFAHLFGDAATCERRLVLACTGNTMIPDVGYQAADVQACVDELRGSDCDDFTFPAARGPACARLERGTRKGDEPCSDDLQCQSGACDTTEMSALAGCNRCVPLVSAGGFCMASTPARVAHSCEVGFYCSSDSNTCTAVRHEGEACDDDRPSCATGLQCFQFGCTAVLREGDQCNAQTAVLCDAGRELSCDTQQGICVKAQPALRKAGEDCSPSATVSPICAPRAFCATFPAPSTPPTCMPLLEDGEPCDAFSGENPCLYPSTCVDGQCGPPDPAECKAG